MDDHQKEELQQRVQRLENRVEELEDRLGSGDASAAKKASGELSGHEPAPESIHSKVGAFQFNEYWLNRIGIGLLLIGVAFLFKYTIDQGWLIPPIRSAVGLSIGLMLFLFGYRMSPAVGTYRQTLLGGGIAVFYITGFATYQLYSFLPVPLIWAFMIVVTLLALSLSLEQNEPVLSVTGILGALGTPFMLYSGSGEVTMLVAYLSLVMVAGGIIYYRKGWASLLWTLMVGGLGALFVGVITPVVTASTLKTFEQWILQLGMLVWIGATWIVAVVRLLVIKTDRIAKSVYLAVFWVPLWLLLLMSLHWEYTANQTAVLSLVLATAGGFAFFELKQENLQPLGETHGFMGIIMLTIAVVFFFEGTMLYTLLAIDALILRYVARRRDDIKLNISAHLLFLIVLYWTVSDLAYGGGIDSSFIDIKAIVQLFVILMGGALIPRWLRRSDMSGLYRICSHLVLLYWIYHLFIVLTNGQAWVTIVWGLYAIGLVVAGFTWYRKRVRTAGLLTVILVVGKLFLVDLAQLQALWRILLFIGLGGALIVLGYYLQTVINNSETET